MEVDLRSVLLPGQPGFCRWVGVPSALSCCLGCFRKSIFRLMLSEVKTSSSVERGAAGRDRSPFVDEARAHPSVHPLFVGFVRGLRTAWSAAEPVRHRAL